MAQILHAVRNGALIAVAVAALAAPKSADAGVIITNPEVAAWVQGRAGWTVYVTGLDSSDISFTKCAGGTSDATLDSAGNTTTAPVWDMPSGTFCSVEMDFPSAIYLDAYGPDGRIVHVTVDLGTVQSTFTDDIITSSGGSKALFAELGGGAWLSHAETEVDPDETVYIAAGDPGYTFIRNELRDTLWYTDDNGNHSLSNSERNAGDVGAP